MEETEGIRLEVGPVATLTIDRPPANAIARPTLEALRGAVARLASEREVRAVIVTGAGEKVFSAGADLKERARMSLEDVRDYIRAIRDTLTALERLPQPVVAAVNGSAFGGGLELALACDVRVMAEHAEVGLTETSLGIIPGGGGTQRLPRLIGRARAMELITAARRIGAAEAHAIGLVHEVTPAEEAPARARALAQQIAANAPLAVRLAKQAVSRGLELPIDEALALETELYEQTLATKDRLEGLTAFSEKRPPVFRGE